MFLPGQSENEDDDHSNLSRFGPLKMFSYETTNVISNIEQLKEKNCIYSLDLNTKFVRCSNGVSDLPVHPMVSDYQTKKCSVFK